jgi:diguanylate cyclase (GGDEF)-like protein
VALPGSEVALRGQGVRQKFFVVFAIAGVIPLLVALYLGLPLVRPGIADSGFYPRDALFFWFLVFFLAALELLALYMGLDLVRAVTRLSAAVAASGLAGGPPAGEGRADEVGVLGQAFATLMDTTREQGDRLRGYGTRIDHLERELRAARQRLRDGALADELTEIGSPRLLRLRLEDEAARAARFGHPLSLVRLAVEGEAAFRERQGAAAADALVQRLAARLRALCRDADVPCRVAGAVFAVLLPESPRKAGLAVADRAGRALEEVLAATADAAGLRLAACVAAAPEDGSSPADLLRAAGVTLPAAGDAEPGAAAGAGSRGSPAPS